MRDEREREGERDYCIGGLVAAARGVSQERKWGRKSRRKRERESMRDKAARMYVGMYMYVRIRIKIHFFLMCMYM